MTDPKQITDAAELVGKTIARTHSLYASGWYDAAIIFTDGSFLLLEAEGEDASICINARPPDQWTLEGLGVITEDERKVRVAERQKTQRAKIEADERARLAELLAKYPDAANGGTL